MHVRQFQELQTTNPHRRRLPGDTISSNCKQVKATHCCSQCEDHNLRLGHTSKAEHSSHHRTFCCSPILEDPLSMIGVCTPEGFMESSRGSLGLGSSFIVHALCNFRVSRGTKGTTVPQQFNCYIFQSIYFTTLFMFPQEFTIIATLLHRHIYILYRLLHQTLIIL